MRQLRAHLGPLLRIVQRIQHQELQIVERLGPVPPLLLSRRLFQRGKVNLLHRFQ